MFDVTMGSFEGAEICEFIGLFVLYKLNEKFKRGNIGLYREDGLAAVENLNGRAADKTRKEFTRIFGALGLKITVQYNLKVADFLDVTLNLNNGKYYPFRKPDNQPVYINARSNHPPSMIKHLPAAINHRISSLSCNEEEFHFILYIYIYIYIYKSICRNVKVIFCSISCSFVQRG